MGEWIWRPLVNPERLQYSAFSDRTPKGFGLLQRQRAFYDFEDIDGRFGDRPSVWVEPLGDWGEGTIDLIEIAQPAAKSMIISSRSGVRNRRSREIASHYFRYRLHWGWEPPVRSNKAYAAQTRVGAHGLGQTCGILPSISSAAVHATLVMSRRLRPTFEPAPARSEMSR